MNITHKTALLTWAVVYPLITGLLVMLEPHVAALPMPVRTLILTGIMVPIMSYFAMPLATRLAGSWLEAGTETHAKPGESQ